MSIHVLALLSWIAMAGFLCRGWAPSARISRTCQDSIATRCQLYLCLFQCSVLKWIYLVYQPTNPPHLHMLWCCFSSSWGSMGVHCHECEIKNEWLGGRVICTGTQQLNQQVGNAYSAFWFWFPNLHISSLHLFLHILYIIGKIL